MSFPKKANAQTPEEKYGANLLPNEGPSWLNDVRRNGLLRFYERGLPSAKLERWKYTNLASRVRDFSPKLTQAVIKISGSTQYAKTLIEDLDDPWIREMFEMTAAGDARHKDMGLWHLAQAYARDGLAVDVPAGVKSSEALQIEIQGLDDSFTSPQFFFRAQEDSEFTITERLEGKGTYWNNALTHIHVGKNAKLRHYRTQDCDESAVFTQNTFVTIEEGGVYEAFVLTKGGKVSRNQVHAEIKGSNAACNLFALNLLNGDQLGDSTWLIEHQAPNCTSDQSVRSLLAGKSEGVFQGKIHVYREGQKTDGYQLSNALLLSDHAQMNTKPELEIYADDVKCSHGATTGQLDEEALFYMRSRGLSKDEARFLVINAFIAELTGKMTDESYADEIQKVAEAWLRNAL